MKVKFLRNYHYTHNHTVLYIQETIITASIFDTYLSKSTLNIESYCQIRIARMIQMTLIARNRVENQTLVDESIVALLEDIYFICTAMNCKCN